ncbi:MAG TPA: SMC-Scp complex subunit ScpB [Baekduia sp.]
MTDLARTVEALLFLSTEPVTEVELIAACECAEEDFAEALAELQENFKPGARGLELRELAGGWTLATASDTEQAARRLLSKPRTPPLSPAQAETLAIVAYLQPVSRPEITRIRGVSADSAAGTLLERGLIEESGRSPFGAVLYRTTSLFLKLFGMASLDDLPEVEEWDPSPEEEADLRERLLRAGEARAGAAPTTQGMDDDGDEDEDEPPIEGDAADPAAEGLTPEADAEAEAAEAEAEGRAEAAPDVGEDAAADDDGEDAAPARDAAPADPLDAPLVERIPAEDVAEADDDEPPSAA